MVSYVSCSSNKDKVPARCINYPWLLYPRHADRLEAMGILELRDVINIQKQLIINYLLTKLLELKILMIFGI
jgi:hypothetical protein